MAENSNTSKKRLKNIAKSGGWDPAFVQVKTKKEKPTDGVQKPDHMRGAAMKGNRPADATRKKNYKNRRNHRYERGK